MAAMATASFPFTNSRFDKAASKQAYQVYAANRRNSNGRLIRESLSQRLPCAHWEKTGDTNGRLFEYHDGNIGTYLCAECAACAFIHIDHHGWSISLTVDLITQADQLAGTRRRTKPTPFTAQFIYLNSCHNKSL